MKPQSSDHENKGSAQPEGAEASAADQMQSVHGERGEDDLSIAGAPKPAPAWHETCPDCSGLLIPESGCWMCRDCGYSSCG